MKKSISEARIRLKGASKWALLVGPVLCAVFGIGGFIVSGEDFWSAMGAGLIGLSFTAAFI